MAVVRMNNLISKHPSPNRKLAARVAACGVTVALAAGCGGGGGKSSPKPQVTVSGGASSPGTLPTSAAGDTTGTPALAGGVTPKYPLLPTPIPAYTGKDLAKWTDPMKAASDRGLKVWIETDLVGAWLTGPDAFTKAVSKVGAEAQTPGVVGFKIADELGQPGQKTTTSPQQAMLFLHDARAALNSVAPGKLILVDIIGFDLGCVPGSSSSWQKKCVESNGAADASMSLDTIGQIVDSGYIDELNVTTYMQDAAKYQKTFGVSLADAQRAAFAEIKNRHWDTKVVVNTRKAFSFPTDKIADANAAAALVGDFIDVPITAGAKAVDTWAFSQKYAKSPSGTVSQMSPGSQSNALWEAFKAEKAKNVNLFTHYTPSTPMGTVQQDMDNIAQAFTGVFCAAGTG